MSSKTDGKTPSAPPKFTYTTAGTIYNPDSLQPIQAPTRRVRSHKWGMTSAASSELSFLPKSVIASLPMSSSHSRNNASMNPDSVVPQYSPLQQNLDRAVSPIASAQSPRSPSPADMEPSQIWPGSVPPNQPVISSEPIFDNCKPTEKCNMNQDEPDEDMSEDPITTLTVKSLNSLASYPNPNQQKAQKALRARPGARSAASTGGNNTNSRSATPSFGTFSFGSSDLDAGRSTSPTAFRTGALIFSAEGKQRETGPVRQFNSLPPELDGLEFQSADNTYGGNTVYKSNLASGPGAPKPLTAGPPGQRQYKAGNIDPTLRNPQNNTPHKFVVADDDPAAVEFRALLQNTNKLAATEMLCPANASGGVSFQFNEVASPLKGLRHTSVPETTRMPAFGTQITQHTASSTTRGPHIWDTKHSDEVKDFYPGGGPSFQNLTSLDPDWQEMYPLYPEWHSKAGIYQRSDVQKHNSVVHRQFYAGAGAFEKSVEQIAREEEQRHHRETVGVIGQGRPPRSQPKQAKMRIEEANEMSTAEAAKPFLKMILTSMINGMEETERITKQYAPSS
ncbi:hypothetical protein ACHAQH_006930 [Verticillium albo-atrum]